jgi:hypothetical protein
MDVPIIFPVGGWTPPLAQMSSNRVTNLYDLMDAAYDSPEIHAFSKSLDHVPIIDHNSRRGLA